MDIALELFRLCPLLDSANKSSSDFVLENASQALELSLSCFLSSSSSSSTSESDTTTTTTSLQQKLSAVELLEDLKTVFDFTSPGRLLTIRDSTSFSSSSSSSAAAKVLHAPKAILLVLSDLIVILSRIQRAAARSKKNSKEEKSLARRIELARRKLLFYLSWSVEFGEEEIIGQAGVLPAIEAEMRAIIARNEPFQREVWSREQLIETWQRQGETFKAEWAAELPEGEELTVYRAGKGEDAWLDMCRGPHLASTGKVDPHAFKLTRVSGAYWRGDQKNAMLSRIYGTGWLNKKQLDAHLHMLEEAAKRDHRKIGQEMDLFHLQAEAQGSVFWHPNGFVIWRALEAYLRRRLDAARLLRLIAQLFHQRNGELPGGDHVGHADGVRVHHRHATVALQVEAAGVFQRRLFCVVPACACLGPQRRVGDHRVR